MSKITFCLLLTLTIEFQTIVGQTTTGPLHPQERLSPAEYSRLTNSSKPVSIGQVAAHLGAFAEPQYTVGQNVPALGGYIGYLDQTGVHGIVVALNPGTQAKPFTVSAPWCVGYSAAVTGAVNNSDAFFPTSTKGILYSFSSQFLNPSAGATVVFSKQNTQDYGFYTSGRMNTKILCEKSNGGYWSNFGTGSVSSIITYAFNLCFTPSYFFGTGNQSSFYDWYIPAAKEIQMVYLNCQNHNVDSQTLEAMFGSEVGSKPIASSTEADATNYLGYLPDTSKNTSGTIGNYSKVDPSQSIRVCIFRCF